MALSGAPPPQNDPVVGQDRRVTPAWWRWWTTVANAVTALESTGPAPAGAGAVPVGGIIMWSGTIATIPATWALCDGTHNAPGPDLRDTFIVGARQDSGGVAKSNIEGSLKQTGGVTAHVHSAHANLTHTGASVADHTGLTHGLSIGNHPDLTHAALSHPATTLTHPDHSVASATHSHAAFTLTHVSQPSMLASRPAVAHTHASGADISVPSQAIASGVDISDPSGSIASGVDISIASGSHTHAASTITGAVLSTATHSFVTTGGAVYTHGTAAASVTVPVATHTGSQAAATASRPSLVIPALTGSRPSLPVAAVTGSRPALSDAGVSGVDVSVAGQTIADHSAASFSGTQAAFTLTHADHSFPSLSHQAIGTHLSTDYGVHAFTAPAAHGTAGTLTHSFTEPSDHTVSAHDSVVTLPTYYALAFIQRVS